MRHPYFLCLFILYFSFSACNCPTNTSRPLFLSSAIQDSVVAYLAMLDSVPNPSENPIVTTMCFLKKENNRYLDTDAIILQSYPGFGSSLFDTSSVLLCSGRLNGDILFVYGNPEFKNLLDWEHFRLSEDDQIMLSNRLERMTLSGEIVEAWQSYCEFKMYSLDSLVRVRRVIFGRDM